ncbi:MAG TPA: hypothetical protein VND64_07235 [Pirellulales bacterium]|nr:hypothetical protein [Pirellulales bacterium]
MTDPRYANFTPAWARGQTGQFPLLNDTPNIGIEPGYIKKVANNLKRRLDMQHEREALEGRLIAVDLARGTLKVELAGGEEVRGTFERSMAGAVIVSLNRMVTLHGDVTRKNRRLVSIRVLLCELSEP